MLGLPFTPYSISGSRVPCPLCDSRSAENLSRWDRRLKRLPHVKCSDCSLIRHEFMPSDTELADYYRLTYRADYQNARTGPSERHVIKRRAEAAQRLDRLSPHLGPGATLVDFGCGSGEFIEGAIARGYRAQGFEPGLEYASYARDRRNLPVENCGWQNYPVPSESVEAVTSFHVFEHLTDPLSAARRMASWLKPDGIAYVEVPNMANALHKGFGSLHMAHTLGFGRYNLELLGAMVGLAVVEAVDDYDIGLIFRNGKPRDIGDIKADARAELGLWTQQKVHRTFWSYTSGKFGWRRFSAADKSRPGA